MEKGNAQHTSVRRSSSWKNSLTSSRLNEMTPPANVYKGRRPKIVFTSGRMTCLTSRSWKGYKGLDLSVIGLYPQLSKQVIVDVGLGVRVRHLVAHVPNVVEQVPIHKLPPPPP